MGTKSIFFVAKVGGLWYNAIVLWGEKGKKRKMNTKRRSGRARAILSFAAVLMLAANVSQAKYSGGTGEPNNPYRIATAEDLNDIGNHPEDFNDCFILVNDINMVGYTGTQFNIIGPNSTTPFTGVFDGNNRTVSNFTYDSTGVNLIALFGKVSGEAAVIKDLGLVGPEVRAGTGLAIGSLVGSLSKGTILSCYVTDCNVWGRSLVGGLVGANPSGTIRDCHATGIVAANDDVGGLVGGNGVDGVISDSFATATVSGTGVRAGGLAGGNTGYISNCYATGSVTGTSDAVGGLGGSNDGDLINSYATGNVEGDMSVGGLLGTRGSDGTVTDCYATGAVTGTQFVGSLVGYSFSSDVAYTKCFWNNTVNPLLDGIGNANDPNVIGKSTAQMQMESTFTDSGWDFVGETINGPNDIWRMCVDGVSYPLLWWQFSTGDFVCSDGVDFIDYSFLASHWRDINCAQSNNCDRTDLDFSDTVDWADLKIFCDHWLEGAAP